MHSTAIQSVSQSVPAQPRDSLDGGGRGGGQDRTLTDSLTDLGCERGRVTPERQSSCSLSNVTLILGVFQQHQPTNHPHPLHCCRPILPIHSRLKLLSLVLNTRVLCLWFVWQDILTRLLLLVCINVVSSVHAHPRSTACRLKGWRDRWRVDGGGFARGGDP